MRHLFASIFAVLVLFISGAQSWAQNSPPPFPAIGRTAPDFTLTDQQGRKVRLADLRGRLSC